MYPVPLNSTLLALCHTYRHQLSFTIREIIDIHVYTQNETVAPYTSVLVQTLSYTKMTEIEF